MFKKIIAGLLLACTCGLFVLLAPSAIRFETSGFSDLTGLKPNQFAGTVQLTLPYYLPLVGSNTKAPCEY